MGRLPLFLAMFAGAVMQKSSEHYQSGETSKLVLCCFIAATLWVAGEVFFKRSKRASKIKEMSENMTDRETHLNKVASLNFAFAVDVLSQLQSLDAGLSLLQIAIREGDPHKELLVRASDLLKEVKQLRASYPALGPDSPPSWREEYIAQ